MAKTLGIKPGIDGIPVQTIPDDPAQFTSWFKSNFIPRWAANADIRNATAGLGIDITGTLGAPATIAVSANVQALFNEPYLLAVAPSDSALNDYRTIAVQAGVLSAADGGVKNPLTLAVVNNGIGPTQFRQSVGLSVVGNAGAGSANVADIAATSNGQVLTMAGGTLGFGTLAAGSLAAIGGDTVLGNATGSSAAPAALSQAQLTALVNVATASLSGAGPVLSNVATQFLNGTGAYSTPAYPTAANPSTNIGLSAVNGSAATFMRSDGAPALSVAIVPTWTGAHTWSALATFNLSAAINAASNVQALTITGFGGTSEPLLVAAAGGQQIANFDSTNAAGGFLRYSRSGAFKGFIGDASSLISGTLDDFALRAANRLCFGAGGANQFMILSTAGALSITGALGWNGATPPAQITGFGTPVGGAVVASYNITDAGGANSNTNKCVAEILAIMKAHGMIGN